MTVNPLWQCVDSFDHCTKQCLYPRIENHTLISNVQQQRPSLFRVLPAIHEARS